MAIKFIQGSVLLAKDSIICHQVNCKGVMGAGLALQIRTKYPLVYTRYIDYCKLVPSKLGTTLFVQVSDNNFIANVFGQDGYGRNGQHTDYDALKKALVRVNDFAQLKKLSVAIPYGLGCGLAGGSWNTVLQIIKTVFPTVTVSIYQL